LFATRCEKNPYPLASQARFFTFRWSCSITLLRYLLCRS
jgi:hypothetical protein